MGVDACKAGWVGIALGGTEPVGYIAATIGGLVDLALADGPLDVLAIDMPIGLPDNSPREADRMARAKVGPRRSSVFTTPTRQALEEPDFRIANVLNRDVTGMGVSKQAHALRVKLLEVDRFVRTSTVTTIEAHPEVSFAHMNEAPLTSGKVTWAGVLKRFGLLRDEGIHLTDDLGFIGLKIAVDDVLDAAAAPWTAHRFHTDEAISLPNPPEVFKDGIPAAIRA